MDIMSIAALSVDMHQQQDAMQLDTAVMKMAMDTQTEMMEQADIEKLQGRISNICMGRIAQPKDIAGGCLLLASDYASYISGQVLPVDGCTIM